MVGGLLNTVFIAFYRSSSSTIVKYSLISQFIANSIRILTVYIEYQIHISPRIPRYRQDKPQILQKTWLQIQILPLLPPAPPMPFNPPIFCTSRPRPSIRDTPGIKCFFFPPRLPTSPSPSPVPINPQSERVSRLLGGQLLILRRW